MVPVSKSSKKGAWCKTRVESRIYRNVNVNPICLMIGISGTTAARLRSPRMMRSHSQSINEQLYIKPKQHLDSRCVFAIRSVRAGSQRYNQNTSRIQGCNAIVKPPHLIHDFIFPGCRLFTHSLATATRPTASACTSTYPSSPHHQASQAHIVLNHAPHVLYGLNI